MLVSELIKSAFQAISTNKKRSFLTILGIAIGIAAVITILGIGDGVSQTMRKNLGNNATKKTQTTEIDYTPDDISSATHGFTADDLTNIQQKFPEVRKIKIYHVSHNITTHGSVGMNDGTYSVTLLKKATSKMKVIAGKNLSQSQLDAANKVALIKESIAKKNYGTIQNALGTTVNIEDKTYTVVGVYKNHGMYTNLGDVNKYSADILVPKKGYYTAESKKTGDVINMKILTNANPSKISKKIEKYLKKNGTAKNQGVYQYYDTEKALKQFSTVINIITALISFVAGISLFIAGIGVMNMMYISVSERTQEIGIRLAVGATPQNIMTQFLLEAVSLTVIGGLIGFISGAGLAHLIAPLLSSQVGNGVHIKAHISMNAFVLAFGVSALIGIIFGILPAKQAANKNLIDILR